MAKAKKARSNSTTTSNSRKASREKSAPAARPTAATQGSSASKSPDKAKEVTVTRRTAKDRRAEADRRQRSEPVAVERRTLQRRTKVNRRRQIDPTTCERDYTNEEIEFMSALDEYKRTSGRMFPTCSEVLEVIRGLGYVKESQIEAATPPSPSADEQTPAESPLEQAAAPVIAIPVPVLDGQPAL